MSLDLLDLTEKDSSEWNLSDEELTTGDVDHGHGSGKD